jgi:rhamnosyltransferase
MTESMPKTCALVVCYRDYAAAERCVAALLSQSVPLAMVYVVDNTESPNPDAAVYRQRERVQVLRPAGNVGISGAYELGFTTASAAGMTWCWTFDQDSVPRPNALEELLAALTTLAGKRVGIVASVGISRANGNIYRGTNAKWVRLRGPNTRRAVYPCDLAISSGSLTNLGFFAEFGFPFKDMFIDWVDYALCLGMKEHGYGVYTCQTSFFEHTIGGHEEQATYAAGDEQALSELRLTCLARNSIATILRSGSWIKYPYLVFHLHRLRKYTGRQQRAALWKAVWAGLRAGKRAPG